MENILEDTRKQFLCHCSVHAMRFFSISGLIVFQQYFLLSLNYYTTRNLTGSEFNFFFNSYLHLYKLKTSPPTNNSIQETYSLLSI